jgi:chemotaxis protein MotB
VRLRRPPVEPDPSRVLPALILAAALTGVGGAGGCVPKTRYDKLVAESTQAKLDADAKQKETDARVADLEQQLTAVQASLQDRDAKLSDLSTQNHNVQAALDEQTAMNEQLRDELGRLGKDVDKILADKGTLAKALDDAKARLDELRKAQAAGEARAALFKDFERRFKPLIDGGQLRIDTRRGELVMSVPSDYLFDPGHSELRAAGKGILMQVARTLTLASQPAPAPIPAPTPIPASTPTPTRRYVVTANVDPTGEPPTLDARAKPRGPRTAEPHRGPRARSVWELSADQAVAVVEYLVSLGVAPDALTAAGAGSFDPVAPGDDPVARSKNRRVEIALAPEAP